MSEKSAFCETLSPQMTSQSFPVSCFWSRGFVPPEVKFLICNAHSVLWVRILNAAEGVGGQAKIKSNISPQGWILPSAQVDRVNPGD